jgi:hypothetical protein
MGRTWSLYDVVVLNLLLVLTQYHTLVPYAFGPTMGLVVGYLGKMQFAIPLKSVLQLWYLKQSFLFLVTQVGSEELLWLHLIQPCCMSMVSIYYIEFSYCIAISFLNYFLWQCLDSHESILSWQRCLLGQSSCPTRCSSRNDFNFVLH